MKTDTGISTGQITEYIRPELKPKAGWFRQNRTDFRMLARRITAIQYVLLCHVQSEQQTTDPPLEYANIPDDDFLYLTGEGERAMQQNLRDLEEKGLISRQYPERRYNKGGYKANLEKLQKLDLRHRRHACRQATAVAPTELAACKLERAHFSALPPDAGQPAVNISVDMLTDDFIRANAELLRAKLNAIAPEPVPVPEQPVEAPGQAETGITGAQLSALDPQTPYYLAVSNNKGARAQLIAEEEAEHFKGAVYETNCGYCQGHPLYLKKKNQRLLLASSEDTPEQRLANIRSRLAKLQEMRKGGYGDLTDGTVENIAKVDPAKSSMEIYDACRQILGQRDNNWIETWGGVIIALKRRFGRASP